MYKFLESLSDVKTPHSKRGFKPEVANKVFVNTRTSFTFETENIQAHYDTYHDTFQAHLTPYGKYNGSSIGEYKSYSGINAAYITPEGLYLFESMAKKISDMCVSDDFAAFHHADDGDNCAGFLYNLLRMFYATTMKHIKYTPTERFFQGNHVHVTNEQFFGTDFKQGYKWKAMVEVIPTPRYYLQDCGEVWLQWSGELSDKNMQILSAAASACTETSPLGVLHPSSALTNAAIRLAVQENKTPQKTWSEGTLDLESLSTNDVERVIRTLVGSNRLYGSFDMALAMVAQIYSTHKPSIVEDLALFYETRTVFIPRLTSFRGWNPHIVGGEPYAASEDESHAFNKWAHDPLHVFLTATALSEVTHQVMHMFANNDKLNGFLRSLSDKLRTASSGEALAKDLMLASILSGKAVGFPKTYAGLERFPHFLPFLRDWPTREIPITVESADGLRMHPGILPQEDSDSAQYPFKSDITVAWRAPFVLPVLTKAVDPAKDILHSDNLCTEIRVNDDLWHPERSLICTSWSTDFNKLMSIFRMMGIRATGTERESGREFSNWTDSGWFDHHAPPEIHIPFYQIEIASITANETTFRSVPDMSSFVKVAANILSRSVRFE